jgi:lysophospholipase L1-like esterase
MFYFDEEGRIAFLQKFYTRIEKIQADPLIVVSILPRNFQRQQSSRVNEVIRNVNNRVEKGLDSLNGRFEYLDVYPLFTQDEYEARMDLFKDGLHPNIAGQEILASEVLKVLR